MRGIDSRQEVNPGLLLRDTRTFGQKVGDFFGEPFNVALLLACCAITAFFMPYISDLIGVIGVICFVASVTRKQTLPFRLPKTAKSKDYNDVKPGTKTPNRSRGIAFLGNQIKNNEELWFTNEDMRTHVLIFGSTGSGKTEALVSFAYNALLHGSGFIYVDGKGDNTLYAKIFSMVRSMGREDDLLVVNFMTGARDIVGPQEKRLSNTLNPFATGSSSMLAQLVVSLMDSSSQSSDGDMWKGRAISFVEALMKVLVYMRDRGAILLDANTIRNYFLMPKLEPMVMDHAFLRDGQEPVSLEGIPEVVLEPIKNYIFNLPGYSKEKKGKQVSQVLEQHGFITMQLGRVFTSLADTYGHILRVNLAEVDFKDVVLNRRILVVLLPALEKSPDELANLGKVIIASLKSMMAAGLGEEVEGAYRDIIERKPTTAVTPFLCVLDEYGYYAVKGFAVVPAQARSLGFSTIFAGQDLPAFQKASKEEAASIGANTNIKICMKLEDPTETWEFFTKTAGEAYVTKVDAFSTKETSMTNNYQDTKSSSFEKRARIDLLDLKDQAEGMAHIFFKSKIIRARLFYANPKLAKKMRINHFLRVEMPPDQTLYELQERTKKFDELMQKGDIFSHLNPESKDIHIIKEALSENKFLDPIERAVSALLAYHNYTLPEEAEFLEEVTSDETNLNVFAPIRISENLEKVIIRNNTDRFEKPLLNRQILKGEIDNIEKIVGRNDGRTSSIAGELIKDMQTATNYPPEHRDQIEEEGLAQITLNMIQKIQEARKKGEEQGSS